MGLECRSWHGRETLLSAAGWGRGSTCKVRRKPLSCRRSRSATELQALTPPHLELFHVISPSPGAYCPYLCTVPAATGSLPGSQAVRAAAGTSEQAGRPPCRLLGRQGDGKAISSCCCSALVQASQAPQHTGPASAPLRPRRRRILQHPLVPLSRRPGHIGRQGLSKRADKVVGQAVLRGREDARSRAGWGDRGTSQEACSQSARASAEAGCVCSPAACAPRCCSTGGAMVRPIYPVPCSSGPDMAGRPQHLHQLSRPRALPAGRQLALPSVGRLSGHTFYRSSRRGSLQAGRWEGGREAPG